MKRSNALPQVSSWRIGLGQRDGQLARDLVRDRAVHERHAEPLGQPRPDVRPAGAVGRRDRDHHGRDVTPRTPGSASASRSGWSRLTNAYESGTSTSLASGKIAARRRAWSSGKKRSSGAHAISTGRSNSVRRAALSSSCSRRTPASSPPRVAPHARVAQERLDPGGEQLVGKPALGQPAERERQPAQRWDPQPLQRDRQQPQPRADHETAEHRRREVVEGVAVGEHEPADPVAMARDDELAQRAAGVVAHQRHVAQVERRDQVGDQTREPGRRDVGVRAASRSRCAPSGRSGTMQRAPSTSRSTTGSHSRPSTSAPWMNTIAGPAPSSR